MDTTAKIQVGTFAVLFLSIIVLFGIMSIATQRKATWHNGLLACMLGTGISAFSIFSKHLWMYSLLICGIGLLIMLIVVFFTYQKDSSTAEADLRARRNVLRWMAVLLVVGILATLGVAWFVTHKEDQEVQKELTESNQDVAEGLKALTGVVATLQCDVSELKTEAVDDKEFKATVLEEFINSRSNQASMMAGQKYTKIRARKSPGRVELPNVQTLSPRKGEYPAPTRQVTAPDTSRKEKPKTGPFNWIKNIFSKRDSIIAAPGDSTYTVQVGPYNEH